jgi:hypothetical protein
MLVLEGYPFFLSSFREHFCRFGGANGASVVSAGCADLYNGCYWRGMMSLPGCMLVISLQHVLNQRSRRSKSPTNCQSSPICFHLLVVSLIGHLKSFHLFPFIGHLHKILEIFGSLSRSAYWFSSVGCHNFGVVWSITRVNDMGDSLK